MQIFKCEHSEDNGERCWREMPHVHVPYGDATCAVYVAIGKREGWTDEELRDPAVDV